jgi:sulfide:quinone oxidoreductase
MKSLVILGAGTAGTLMANKLSQKIDSSEWKITIVDKDTRHYYQPGFLFIPFGIYKPDEVVRYRTEFLPEGVEFLQNEVKEIDGRNSRLFFVDNRALHYDVLIVATGSRTAPEETPGLMGSLWRKDIFDFYTYEGAVALAKKLEKWQGGKLVICLAESTIKCPVAPLEFAFLADSFFVENGQRHNVEITYVTPLSGAFTKPIATEMLSKLLKEKSIMVESDFYLEEVDEGTRVIRSYDGREIPFDLLVSIPVNKGDDVIGNSKMGDEDGLNFVPTDKYTLQSRDHENIFVIGDATNVPASKAGSVAHFEGEILTENILSYINGKPLEAKFDGHANCFIETGFGKAALIDFNYETEPLPGMFPLPVLGPMALLKETHMNHLGKLAFKWVYWHGMLTGKPLPVPNHMSMMGKHPETKHTETEPVLK